MARLPRCILALASFLVLASLPPSTVRAAESAPLVAADLPELYMLLRLPGDRVEVRYVPGSLDRSARLQTRLELACRSFEKWTKTRVDLKVFALTRAEWAHVRTAVSYGVPVRVDSRGIAAPAEGDPGTVGLWSQLLEGALPTVPGIPLRGTPQEAATMILADRLVQLSAADILLDAVGLVTDQPWVRALVAHLVDQSLIRKHEAGNEQDVHTLYQLLARAHEARSFAASDYPANLSLQDWLWFQSQLHQGARLILNKEGKGAVKAMLKLQAKSGGVLTADRLFDRYRPVAEWYRDSFSAVSLRPNAAR